MVSLLHVNSKANADVHVKSWFFFRYSPALSSQIFAYGTVLGQNLGLSKEAKQKYC